MGRLAMASSSRERSHSETGKAGEIEAVSGTCSEHAASSSTPVHVAQLVAELSLEEANADDDSKGTRLRVTCPSSPVIVETEHPEASATSSSSSYLTPNDLIKGGSASYEPYPPTLDPERQDIQYYDPTEEGCEISSKLGRLALPRLVMLDTDSTVTRVTASDTSTPTARSTLRDHLVTACDIFSRGGFPPPLFSPLGHHTAVQWDGFHCIRQKEESSREGGSVVGRKERSLTLPPPLPLIEFPSSLGKRDDDRGTALRMRKSDPVQERHLLL